MARSFASASSQYLSRASTIISGTPFTMACWARVTSATTAQAFMSVNTSSGADRHTLTMNATGNVLANTSGSTNTSTTTGAMSANTWAHCAGVWSASNSRTAYLNGTAATANTANVTPTNLTTFLLGVRRDTTLGLYLNGQLAECCVWSVALSTAEIASLASGLKAHQVRPESILAYWPLGGHFGEVDEDFSGGGHLLTANNSPTWSALYPPIIATPIVTPLIYTTDVTLDLDAIAATTTVYEPTIASTFPLALDNIAATTTVYGPTLTPGAVSILAPLIAATTTVYQPGINAGGLSIDVDTIGPNTTVYEPTLTPGPVSVALDNIAATTTVHEPTVAIGAVNITLPAIPSATVVYNPAVELMLQIISLNVIGPNTVVRQPDISSQSTDTRDVLPGKSRKRRQSIREQLEEENVAAQILRARQLEEQRRLEEEAQAQAAAAVIEETQEEAPILSFTAEQQTDVQQALVAYEARQVRNKRLKTLLLMAAMED